MSVLKKAQVIPGFKVRAVHLGKRGVTEAFWFNAHLGLENGDEPVMQDEEFEVVRGPHERLGVKLVEVKRMSDGKTGKFFFTDFLHRCEPV